MNKKSGFSLVEFLVASGLSVVTMFFLYSIFDNVFSKGNIEIKGEQRREEIKLFFGYLDKDLSNSVYFEPSEKSEGPASLDYRGLVAVTGNKIDELQKNVLQNKDCVTQKDSYGNELLSIVRYTTLLENIKPVRLIKSWNPTEYLHNDPLKRKLCVSDERAFPNDSENNFVFTQGIAKAKEIYITDSENLFRQRFSIKADSVEQSTKDETHDCYGQTNQGTNSEIGNSLKWTKFEVEMPKSLNDQSQGPTDNTYVSNSVVMATRSSLVCVSSSGSILRYDDGQERATVLFDSAFDTSANNNKVKLLSFQLTYASSNKREFRNQNSALEFKNFAYEDDKENERNCFDFVKITLGLEVPHSVSGNKIRKDYTQIIYLNSKNKERPKDCP